MPILDPILQLELSQKKQTNDPKSKYLFWTNYLKIASKYIFETPETIKTYLQYKKDLQKYISFVKEYFECENIDDDLSKIKVPDFYKYFYDTIKEKADDQAPLNGDYFEIRTINFNFNYFQPYLDYSNQRSWYFCNSPIAILVLRANKMKEKNLGIFTLEVDLLSAAGFYLVLIITELTGNFDIPSDYISNLILNHHFLEIHMNYNDDSIYVYGNHGKFLEILENIKMKYNKYDCYFYLYSCHIDITNEYEGSDTIKLHDLYKSLKKKPRFHLISFGDEIQKSLKSGDINKLNNCYYCENGFTDNKLKIILCDVPIYSTDDDIKDQVPNNFAFYNNVAGLVYIQKDDFLYWMKPRVQVGDNKYVDFNDIHYINPDLYVEHTLYLGKVKRYEMHAIDKIIDKTQQKYDDKLFVSFKKEFFLTLFNDKKAKKLLSYVLFAYKKDKHEKGKEFYLLKSQIFVAYRAIDFCIQHRFNSSNSGFVYQVSTGEGKSAIVILIAAVLALFGKTVHVVTSNIILANRDYNDSFKFFAKLGLKSTALLHKNEIPEYNSEIKKENYPYECFNDDIFKNSMEMNFDACGASSDKGKADIIFSNLINFESMYLYMSEKYPGRIKKYYKNSSLVIDEADLTLIDELTNGTILSRAMNSNSEEILTYVYESKCKDTSIKAQEILLYIKDKWPECTDIKEKDIEMMFKEIEMVNKDEEFVFNRKYSLAPVLGNKNKKSNITYKEVVPFNYDHTGILERNKEFSGFIQQFIALKERQLKKNLLPNENLLVKEVSMNYLYISHPIYVSFYSNVCGLTGTIGKKFEKDIFQNHYHLRTKKVPRENPNRRYEFPSIICLDEQKRNEKIVEEIMAFHLKGNPVLAVFLSPSDIRDVKNRIENHKDFINNKVKIGVYDGNNEQIKPDKTAGLNGAISLGTNVCGRGTHIDVNDKPLHVIVTFYTTNSRAMNQVFGRTSRQKNFGTVRTICLLKEFIKEIYQMNDKDRENNLKMLGNVNEMQNEFIEYFRKTRKWIFDINIKSQVIPNDDIRTMRSALVNVNRIEAYNFKFPLCMKYKTFLDIQSQKIFSLYNCPNSMYTWQLFQQYIREMILESWSLFLNRAERKFYNLPVDEQTPQKYHDYLTKKRDKLLNELKKYLPEEKNKLDIVQTFMHIFKKVNNHEYCGKILKMYNFMMPKDDTEEDKTIKKPKMSMIKLGFRPYNLKFKSGSRIYSLIYNQQKIDYIEDPELKYQRTGSDFLSITEKIDNIFNSICNFFSRLIGKTIGFKFFLRRTLGGCEFGICYDFDVEFDDSEVKKLQNCLFDKEPLFVFSISVKSMVPFLAGVLIFFLLYLANIARQMATFASSMTKNTLKIAKKAAIELAKLVAEKAFNELEDRIIGHLCDYLKGILDNQIRKFKYIRENYYLLFRLLSELLIDKIPDAAEKIYGEISPKIKINTKSTFGKIAANGMEHIFKVGFLLILCAASFMINFQIDKSIKYSNTKVASELTKGDNYKNNEKIDNYVNNNEKIFNNDIPKVDDLK